jgi:DNA-binding GntR family transcriptional regulator
MPQHRCGTIVSCQNGLSSPKSGQNNDEAAMTDRTPAHQIAYTRVRDMVLFGELAPGQAVTIEGLVARLDLGMTPVREALRRLIAERALTLQGNRRVSVPRLTLAQLDEVSFARQMLEAKLAEAALNSITDADVTALEAIDAKIDIAIAAGDLQGYLAENHRFHFTLYTRAEAEVLLGLTRSLWLLFGPSLRVVCTAPGQITLPDNHKSALTALRARNCAALVTAITADIVQGVAQIRDGIIAGKFDQID